MVFVHNPERRAKRRFPRFPSRRGALGLVGSDFAGLPISCIADKGLCRECIISNFTPSYPHKHTEPNGSRILRWSAPLKTHKASPKAGSKLDAATFGKLISGAETALGAGLALLGSKK